MSNAIETRALRKVFPLPSRKRGGSAPLLLMPSAPPPAMPPSAVTKDGIVAIDALDLAIPDGEFFGMLGPNGAGKTTTIGILTTRVRPTAGEAVVAGQNVVTAPAAVRRRIGVVPQRPNPDR